MSNMYFEDFEVGQKFTTSGRTVTVTDILSFVGLAGVYNPLFTDEEFAKKSIHRGRITPGPLTFALSLGLYMRMGLFEDSIIAFLGMDRMRLSVPVKPGDTIKVEIELIDKKDTKKADRGIIMQKYTVTNQREETVMTYEMTHLLKRKK